MQKPSWKMMEFVNWDTILPYMKWKIKKMLQTTNQIKYLKIGWPLSSESRILRKPPSKKIPMSHPSILVGLHKFLTSGFHWSSLNILNQVGYEHPKLLNPSAREVLFFSGSPIVWLNPQRFIMFGQLGVQSATFRFCANIPYWWLMMVNGILWWFNG